MADRVRDITKRSGSKLHISKGSVNHIGATPYRFRLDIFISYVDNVKNASEVCVSWERRGNVESTNVVKVKDKKAVFRQSLGMECTLFRRTGKSSTSAADPEELKFDEKKAKFVLRKGGADGKGIGKISLNLADYVRGTSSTVFADMKLSNDAVIVTKIEANMLHVGKKKKTGSHAGSEACSEMTEMSGMDNDSIFGDDDRDLGDLEIPATSTPDSDMHDIRSMGKKVTDLGLSKQVEEVGMSPVSSAASSSTSSLTPKAHSGGEKEQSRRESKQESLQEPSKTSSSLSKLKGGVGRVKKDEELKESPSLKDKLKSKIKKKDKEKEKGDDDTLLKSVSTRSRKKDASREHAAEVAQFKKEIEALKKEMGALKKENEKLVKSKQAAMEEISALRSDLDACEEALEEVNNGESEGGGQATLELSKTLKDKDKKIAELQAQNESLLEELEEVHDGAVDSAVGVAGGQIKQLQRKVEELEIALKREPQYMDVVNELKVTKVSLALANMEKEQAIFALQTATQQHRQEE